MGDEMESRRRNRKASAKQKILDDSEDDSEGKSYS